jgi:phage/plasmid-associated DNA primase
MVHEAFAPLGEALADDSARCLQEFCGAAVLGLATRFHRAVVLQGKPGSGKSEIIRVIKALITGYNPHPTRGDMPTDLARYLSSVDLSQWVDPNYIAAFTTARLNATGELSREALRDGGLARLLTIINGEELSIRPAYERAYKFAPKTAHIFATNDLPQVLAGDEFWDRFLLLRMDRRVRETSAQVEHYGWHVAEEELPRIIAWALEGAARLRMRGRYDLGSLHADIREQWRDESNPVAEWAAAHLRADDTDWTDGLELREAFLRWAKDRGYSDTMSERTFNQRLQQLGYEKTKHWQSRRVGFKAARLYL